MISRLLVSGLVVAAVATACSSSVADVDAAASPTSSPVASDADPGTSEAETNAASTTPPTTFVPELTGPFDLDGGAEVNRSTDGLIIDPDVPSGMPSVLANLPWDTDWSRRTIEDWAEIGRGLNQPDPRDGIPPIDSPIFETVESAGQWLGPREPGALVQLEGEARFYPLGILTRHEIVNDAIGEVPVAVTFCPLCNTALTFDRRVGGEALRFGVSGLLRNSDLVMWDSTTVTLWQQLTGEAIVGEYAGTQLEIIPTAIVSFEQFARDFPDGRSLAAESAGGRRAYGINPYRGYSSSGRPFLFNGEIDERFPALSRVVGVDIGEGKAYPFSVLADSSPVNDVVGGAPVVVWLAGDTADALDQESIAVSAGIGTAVAFSRILDGQELTFAAGDDDTFMDDQTGSTWSVIGRATAGELEGSQLDLAPHRNEFWFAWSAFFAGAEVYAG